MMQRLDELPPALVAQPILVERIRVQVAHAVPLIGAGINAALSASSDFDVGTHARGMTDVLIADVDTALNVLSNDRDERRVLIVAQDDGEVVIRRALERGVRGFLLHTCDVEELVMAVKTVNRGGTAFAPHVANRVVQSFAFEQLTERELEVLHVMVQGLPDKDIARQLLISLGTVKSHVRSILTKLGAARRTEAAAIAQRRGIARLDVRFLKRA